MTGHIIAIGGIDYYAPDHVPTLERYILEQTGKSRPKVCFLPQATAEDYQGIVRFFEIFTRLGAAPSWLSLFRRVPRDWADKLRENDVVFVGGGNTKSMLALWREWGVDSVLKEMLADGKVLAGTSAGAICWYEECVTDSIWPLGAIKGLGFLRGSACPHYDGEVERRPTMLRMVRDGEISPGIALQNAAAAHYVDGEFYSIITADKDARGYQISLEAGEIIEEELPHTYVGD